MKRHFNGNTHPGYNDQEPAGYANGNGKRPMLPTNQYFPPTSSSPRSVPTPIAPHRLTLPRGQQPPDLSGGKDSNQYALGSAPSRPSSSRRIQEFAYMPPEVTQYLAPPPSRAQAQLQQYVKQDHRNHGAPETSNVSELRRRSNTEHQQQQQPNLPNKQNPTVQRSRFKPAVDPVKAAASRNPAPQPPNQRQITNMGPPATPQVGAINSGTGRFVPPTPSHDAQTRRFFSNSGNEAKGSTRFQQGPQGNSGNVVSGRGSGLLNLTNAGSGTQRMAFIPGGTASSSKRF
ncbi:hypothetical protein FA15DRAFT_699678 [Coprinopsis marcescibilis]|uniref:Uncharacterized protein n=1 Tax=Coprinopsis marcescibilis TaxID=230819 RepID=A0A5C3LAQ2_COPMA|nr:hypothetical protein FA15DRAFT_699678 [Coprinopsis marcescibilis]